VKEGGGGERKKKPPESLAFSLPVFVGGKRSNRGKGAGKKGKKRGGKKKKKATFVPVLPQRRTLDHSREVGPERGKRKKKKDPPREPPYN